SHHRGGPRSPAGEDRPHGRHLRLRQAGGGRPDLLRQGLLPGSGRDRRQGVRPSSASARGDRAGGGRQGRDPRQGESLPGAAAPQSERAEKIGDLMEARRASVEATNTKASDRADEKAPVTRTRAISSRRRKSA